MASSFCFVNSPKASRDIVLVPRITSAECGLLFKNVGKTNNVLASEKTFSFAW